MTHSDAAALQPTDTAIARIRLNLPNLSAAEAAAGRWIIANDARLATMSMGMVAQEAGVSDTSVLRLCRRIGFRGYTDLKVHVIGDLARVPSPAPAATAGNGPLTPVEMVFRDCIQGLNDTLSVLGDTLEAAVDLLEGASQILIVGVGTSIPVMEAVQLQLFRIGLNSAMESDSYLQRMKVALLPADSVVIAVSHSGASTDPVETLRLAKEHDLATLCLTGVSASPITEFADVTLTSLATELRTEAVVGRVVQVALVSALAQTYAARHPEASAASEAAAFRSVIDKTI